MPSAPILPSSGSSHRSDAMVSNNCSASSQMQVIDAPEPSRTMKQASFC